MAEEPQGGGSGMGLADLLRTGWAGLSGGLSGLAFSPAMSGMWDRLAGSLGMEGDQAKSLGRLLMAGLSGGAFLPLLSSGWGAAKQFSTPTQARWWSPTTPPGANYGRSDLQGQEMGGPGYLSQPWSAGMQPASYNRHDVHVGPGSQAAVDRLFMQPAQPFASGGILDRMGSGRGPGGRWWNSPEVQSALVSGGGGGGFPGAMSDPFQRTRELLGMGAPGPDFAEVRRLLGMEG